MKEQFADWICPFLSIGKDAPVSCNHNCMLYVSDSGECAIRDIESNLNYIATDTPH